MYLTQVLIKVLRKRTCRIKHHIICHSVLLTLYPNACCTRLTYFIISLTRSFIPSLIPSPSRKPQAGVAQPPPVHKAAGKQAFPVEGGKRRGGYTKWVLWDGMECVHELILPHFCFLFLYLFIVVYRKREREIERERGVSLMKWQ